MYSWNVMFNYLMNIKHEYKEKFNDFDNVSFKEVCQKTNYEQFLQDANLTEYKISHGRFVLVKYNLLNGMTDLYTNPNSIYREGRSLVVNTDTEEIVLCPFRKFFNIDEIPETSMKDVIELISQAKLVEFSDKLDGSMQQYRWYRDQIVFSGSSALDENESMQLAAGKKMFFNDNNYTKLCQDNSDYTFLFECIIEEDPHIVNYVGNSLRLIGARNVYDGSTINYHEVIGIAEKYHLPHTTIESATLEKLVSVKNKFKSNEKEGWVINVIDQNNHSQRYKFKCDDYVNIHHVLSVVSSPNVIIKAIADETYDDLIAQVPVAYRDRVADTANTVHYYMTMKNSIINYFYDQVKNIADQKEFALIVQDKVPKNFIAYMFMKRKNQSIPILKKNHGYIKMNMIEDFIQQNEEFYRSLI